MPLLVPLHFRAPDQRTPGLRCYFSPYLFLHTFTHTPSPPVIIHRSIEFTSRTSNIMYILDREVSSIHIPYDITLINITHTQGALVTVTYVILSHILWCLSYSRWCVSILHFVPLTLPSLCEYVCLETSLDWVKQKWHRLIFQYTCRPYSLTTVHIFSFFHRYFAQYMLLLLFLLLLHSHQWKMSRGKKLYIEKNTHRCAWGCVCVLWLERETGDRTVGPSCFFTVSLATFYTITRDLQ